MKKSFLTIAITLIALLTIVYSCNKTKDEKTIVVAESNTDNLNFLDLNNGQFQDNSSRDIVIIRVKLWRKSTNCLRGMGVCKVEFFPANQTDNISDPGREIDIPISSSFDGGNIIVYLAQDVSMYSAEDLLLYIDGDIEAEDDNSLF